MRLKRLELSGFKTFAERTTLEFATQITGIVGPNGSGKSNIFDAVRWTLGEGSLRSLRSVRTEDIIFAGTERRRPLGMAEVTLTLDNEDGSLVLPPGPDDGDAPPTPLAFAEVTITRRAMRSAESQYFINGLPCRLRDIQMMFLGTGLGGHSYALITQGEVEEMLDATPEERRMILEEAAGLAKYKRRRHDAERRMAAAEATLLRVVDILGELDAQVVQLAGQAEAAERYQAHTRELRALELSLQVEEIRRGRRAQRRVRDHLDDIAARRREIDEVARALVEQRETLDHRVAAAGREWEGIQRERVSLVERRAAAEAAMSLSGERLRGVEAQRQRTERDAARYREEQGALSAEHAALAGAQHGLAADADRARAEIASMGARLGALDVEATRNEEALEARRAEVRETAEVRARLHAEAAAAEAREAARRDQSAALLQRTAGLRTRLDNARTHQAVLVGESDRGASALEALRANLASHRAEHADHVDARDALLDDERHLEIERERFSSRIRFLEDAQAQYRGYDSGARQILLAWRAAPHRLPGMKGALADGLAVPKELRPAIEAALGPHLSALIVSTVDDARASLALHGGEPRGAVTFVPLSTVAVPEAPVVPPAVAADPATRGRAADEITITGDYPDAIRALLADVLIVSDLGGAVRARANGYRGRIATLAGEVLGPEGVLIAGRPLPEQGGILGRTEEASESQSGLDRVEGAIEALAERRSALAERTRATEEAIAATERDEARAIEALAESRRRLTLIEADSERLAGEIAHLEAERVVADQEATAQAALRQGLENEAAALGSRLTEAEQGIERLSAGLRGHAETRRAAESRITELRVLSTEVEARREALRGRGIEIDRTIAQLTARCDELDAELRQLRLDAESLQGERELARAQCEGIDAERARLAATQAALEDERAGLAARQAEVDAQHRQTLDRAAALAEERHKAEVREAQIEAELGGARRRVEEEFGIPFDRAVEAVPESVNRDETLGRIEALRGLIAAIGPVNLLAIEEHRQVAERALALRTQMEDVQGAIGGLRTLIAQLEDVIHGQFEKTYAAVDRQFADIFARLFGGGHAGLERVPAPDGGGEPGVDIVAQPPGKKVRSLGALSGGERVMVALALAFAMLRVRPSPFCVFDEVEAALDEANTRKVGELLRELSAQTQIIIITHNKATMEASDALVGVTMEESGVSQMVSMRLTDPDAVAEPQPVG